MTRIQNDNHSHGGSGTAPTVGVVQDDNHSHGGSGTAPTVGVEPLLPWEWFDPPYKEERERDNNNRESVAVVVGEKERAEERLKAEGINGILAWQLVKTIADRGQDPNAVIDTQIANYEHLWRTGKTKPGGSRSGYLIHGIRVNIPLLPSLARKRLKTETPEERRERQVSEAAERRAGIERLECEAEGQRERLRKRLLAMSPEQIAVIKARALDGRPELAYLASRHPLDSPALAAWMAPFLENETPATSAELEPQPMKEIA